MNNIFKPGDKKYHNFKVNRHHFPSFNENLVHEVCSTYVLAKEIEWSTRLFVLDMLDADEEGIGTMIRIEHISPAFIDNEVEIVAIVDSMKENELICSYTASVGDRVIAKGQTGQKIFKKEKLERIFSEYKSDGKNPDIEV